MTTDTNDNAGVMRRIQKLLNIANDGRGDPNEAAAAAGQAEKLMRKFNIEHADLLTKEIARGAGKFATIKCSANMKRDDPNRPTLQRNPGWACWLAYDVAKLNDCEIRQFMDHRGAVLGFLGFESDAQVAGWMFDYLVGELIKGCKAYQRATTRTKAESESFRRGFVLAMCGKLSKLRAEKVAEMQEAVASRALVVSKTQALVEHFGEFKYRESKTTTSVVGDAYHAGRAAGSKVDVGRKGIGSTAQSNVGRLL